MSKKSWTNNLFPELFTKNTSNFLLTFLGYILLAGFVGAILYIVYSAQSVYDDLDPTIIEPILENNLPKVTWWIISVATIALITTIFDVLKPENYGLSDIEKLKKIREKYFKSVVDKLSLTLESKLETYISNQEFEEAEELIKEKIDSFDKIIDAFSGKQTGILKGTEISDVASFYETTSRRIENEINRQKSVSWINLSIAGLTSALAIAFLMKNYPESINNWFDFLPRLSISVLIELFSFYFLKLYKENQKDIMYWNNEKTNLDIKLFGLGTAVDNEAIGDKDFMQKILTDLIATERNKTYKIKDNSIVKQNSDTKSNNLTDLMNRMLDIVSKEK